MGPGRTAGAHFFLAINGLHHGSMSVPAMVIRPAAEKDFTAIAAIYGEAVRDGYATFELTAPGEAELVRRWQGLLEGGYPYLVAVKDGTVLGYAYAGPYRARPA